MRWSECDCYSVAGSSTLQEFLRLAAKFKNTLLKMPKRPSTENTKQQNAKKPKPSGHWAMGLIDKMKDPEYVVSKDDLVTVIKDCYPKAKFHYLVLPNADISNLKAVKQSDIDLLKHMDKVANDLINEDKHKKSKFKIGYHAEPSMIRLHLHVISDDMDSVCLKNKKHWNSFTTNFFVKSKDIIKNLEETGKIVLPSKEECKSLINTPLKCHKCSFLPKNIPDLKKHILTHK